jgi:hypothetical protein
MVDYLPLVQWQEFCAWLGKRWSGQRDGWQVEALQCVSSIELGDHPEARTMFRKACSSESYSRHIQFIAI